jgi:hypothetical protein
MFSGLVAKGKTVGVKSLANEGLGVKGKIGDSGPKGINCRVSGERRRARLPQVQRTGVGRYDGLAEVAFVAGLRPGLRAQKAMTISATTGFELR